MPDQLKVTYTELQEAAAALTRSSTRVSEALAGLRGPGALGASDFGHKGDKIATWYASNRTAAQDAVQASSHSFQVLASALHRAAAVYALVDTTLGHKVAAHQGGGAH